MKRAGFFLLVFLLSTGLLPEVFAQVSIGSTMVDTNTVVSNLDTPWEILWGPDDHIWITERYGGVSRLNPETREFTKLLTIDEVYEVGESGLLGMALHPDFEKTSELFLVYNYLESSKIKERLVKYSYSDGQQHPPSPCWRE